MNFSKMVYVVEQIILSVAWKGLNVEGSKCLIYRKFTKLCMLLLYVQITVCVCMCVRVSLHIYVGI